MSHHKPSRLESLIHSIFVAPSKKYKKKNLMPENNIQMVDLKSQYHKIKKEVDAAILNAISLESTSWYEPS